MGLMDTLKAAVGSAVGSVSAPAVAQGLEQIYPGGLNGLLQKLQASGYGRQVDS